MRGPVARRNRVLLAGTLLVALGAAIVAGRQLLTVPGSTGAGPGSPPASQPGLAPSVAPTPSPSVAASPPPTPGPAGHFPNGLLIADRGNGRLLIVDEAGRVLWTFPHHGALPPGQQFSADDAFIAPDGRTIVANDEGHDVVDRIDIATGRIVWQYGRYDQPGPGRGQLDTPDDAYPLANGDVVVADIRNCRILEISPASRVVRQWGHTGACTDDPPAAFGEPNGDTPLPDGGFLVTEITGSRVVRLDAAGKVVFDIHVPVRYPSDAQLAPDGSVIVVDYSNPGALLRVSPTGRVLWRYGPGSGPGRLDHPSLAVPLADGTIALNDDFRHRVVVIDPRTNRIVWQYGRTDRPSASTGGLNTPDGLDPIPPDLHLPLP